MKGEENGLEHGRLFRSGIPNHLTSTLNERAVNAVNAFSHFSSLSKICSASVTENDKTRWCCSEFEDYVRLRRQRLGIAGAMASVLPQALLLQLDVIKCNMQTNANKYKSVSSTYHSLLATGGNKTFRRGFVPTLIGYSLHGFVKFPMFDWFKDLYGRRLGVKMEEKHKEAIRWLSVASAEFIAVIFLCPFAMVKLKVETSAPGSWPTSFVPAMVKMYRNRAQTGFPFRPIGAMWLRQIPLAVTQLYLFDLIRSRLSGLVEPEVRYGKYGLETELGIMILSGYGVGLVSTPLSQPADYILSRFTLPRNRGKSGLMIIAEDGLKKAVMRGLGPRFAMVGLATGLHFFTFEAAFRLMHLSTANVSKPLQ